MSVSVEEVKSATESKYIGLSPSTTNVKPVHIANGLYRTILGKTFSTNKLNRFVFTSKHNGEVPNGHSLDQVYAMLCENDLLDTENIRKDDLTRLRVLLKKVLNADKGVFNNGMESYSAGYVGFLTKDRIGQDGGEFAAEWLKRNSPGLYHCIASSIELSDDIITVLCKPLLEVEGREHTPRFDYANVICLNSDLPPGSQALWRGLSLAAETLTQHVSTHPNKLIRLRFTDLFVCFFIIRYLSALEGYYCNAEQERAVIPFLLDFSTTSSDPIAKASGMTYLSMCQSVSRFYAWAFGNYLKELYSLEELRELPCPIYRGRTTPSPDTKEIWDLAVIESITSNDPFTTCGQALYDIMSLEAEANPIAYLRNLGLRCGLMWPPNQAAKRFIVKQDMLDVLIRGAVAPGEVVDMACLQLRFWERYGILIGGRPEDEDLLLKFGIYYADSNALAQNRSRFAHRLGALDFAKLLADGVLQIELGGA